MKRYIAFVVLFISAFCQIPFSRGADASDAAARARIDQRVPQVDSLKKGGVVGENNRGFLEVRGAGSREADTLVGEENKDREIVYAALAKQTGASPEHVGKARARYILQHSISGVWIQTESGQWKQK